MDWYHSILSSPIHCCIIFGCSTFVISLYMNQLFMWCFYPTILILTIKASTFVEGQKQIWDSTWFYSVVALVRKLQKYFKRLDLTIVSFNSNNFSKTKANTVDMQSSIIYNYIKRDFIASWVKPITDNSICIEHFSETILQLQDMFFKILMNLDKQKTLEICIDLYQKHLKDFKEAQNFLKIQPKYRFKKNREKEFKKLKTVVDVFCSHHSHHIAFKSCDQESEYLRSIVQVCFIELLESITYDCHPGRELVTDVIAGSVLRPFVQLISQPFWLHMAIIKLTSDSEIFALKNNCDKTNINQTESAESTTVVKDSDSVQNVFKKKSKAPAFYLEPKDEENRALKRDLKSHDDLTSLSSYGQSSSDNNIAERIGTVSNNESETENSDHSTFIMSNSSSVASGNDFEVDEALDACSHIDTVFEQPEQLFTTVNITSTQKVKELNGTGIYVIYNIKYEAWYKSKAETWCLAKGIASRRYREFITLHERFEDHPDLKKGLKGIKGPGKWFLLPFGNTDDATTEKRKRDLQTYLEKIIAVPKLSTSMALREFMAYNGDTTIAFVRKPSDLYVFDQVFIKTVKKVSNIFDKLNPVERPLPTSRTAPSLTSVPTPWLVDPNALHVSVCPNQNDSNDNTQRLEGVVSVFNQKTDNSDTESADKDFHDVLENSFIKIKRFGKSDIDKQCPLSTSLLDLALQTVEERECWVKHEKAVNIIKILLGRFFEVFINAEIEKAIAPERCTYYLEVITNTFWPDGVLDLSSFTPTDQQKYQLRKQAKESLYNFFPGFLPVLLGHETFQCSIDEVLDSLDHSLINKHFAYCLIDVLLEQLFPDITSASTQQQLLSTTDTHLSPNTYEHLDSEI